MNKHPTETQLPTSTKTPHNKAPEEMVSLILDAVLQGQPVAHVAREFGVSRQAIYNYIVRHAHETREAKDALYASRMDKLLEKMLNEADAKDISETSLRDLIVSMGIVVDKREKFHGPKPPSAKTPTRLSIRWADGTGAFSLDMETTSPLPTQSPGMDPLQVDTTVDTEGFTVNDEGEAVDILEPVDVDYNEDDPMLCGEGPEGED